MRLRVLLLSLIAVPGLAQDAMQLANQQMQMVQQVNLQTAAATQQQLNQQAIQASLSGYIPGASKPQLIQEPGPRPGTISIRLKDRSRGAVIYYTTDGWTPTPASARYEGPIVVDRTTTLQAVALAPGALRSAVLNTTITLPAPAPAPSPILGPEPAALTQVTLADSASVPLIFTAPVISRGLQVGDRLPVALAVDLLSSTGSVLAPRLTPVLATVTEVDGRGRQGLPGSITFAVRSVAIPGSKPIPLEATRTIEGEPRTRAAIEADFVPLGGLFVRGGEAAIPAGATLVARAGEARASR